MAQQSDKRRRRHPGNTRGGAQRFRLPAGQLLARLVGQPADRSVIQTGRQRQLLVAADGIDIGSKEGPDD